LRHLLDATSSGTDLLAGFAGRYEETIGCVAAIATRRSARDEFLRSMQALAGAHWEIERNRPGQLRELAVFLPSNNVLYSYVLMALIPSMYSDRVYVRPSSRVLETTRQVHELLSPLVGEKVRLSDCSQRDFVEVHSGADAMVFSGRYENARKIAGAIDPSVRFLAFGSGPNPMVVGPEANIAETVHDVVLARLYNSGQDCLCPDVIFVSRTVAEAFTDALCERAAAVTVGARDDPDTMVAPLSYPDAVEAAAAFLDGERENVVLRGAIRVDENMIEPSVVSRPFCADLRPPELFSPIFSLVVYERPADLLAWFQSDDEMRRGMYASVYGEPGLPDRRVLGTSVSCGARTTFDVENGNAPFGGYGPQANFVAHRGRISARPLLLSSEVSG
jgi:acyl-CoA reductase-like NAD-dependent aldehyde dehydrogenase